VNLTVRVGTFLRKAAAVLAPLSPYQWWPSVLESYTGAWQSNVTIDRPTVIANWAVFSCVTLIMGDVGKMPATVMQWNSQMKIWDKTLNRPVLRKPNRYQTRIEFIRMWVASLLLHGNTYILKERDSSGFIVALYILDPYRVKPLISADGAVYYQLAEDLLSGLEESLVVPASEIIHDRLHTLFHPLIGVSPIYACGVAAMQGAAIQNNSAQFFNNMSRPSGILTAPGSISTETSVRLKEYWTTNFSGTNAGKVAVVGDGLKYEAMTITAEDSQLIEQLKFTGEMICAVFHVPAYKVGLGPMPTANNTAALNQQYYEQALQPIVDNIELRLDEGLELEFPFETWLDESVLLRMDPWTRLDAHSKAIGGGWLAPNEARREENKPAVPGGDSPMMQQQNYSLIALQKRDERSVEESTDVQAAAMNGAQVTSLQGILLAAATGQLPPETARAAIQAAFPLLTPEQVNEMVAPLAEFEPAEPDPTPGQPTDDVDEEALTMSYVIGLRKELDHARAA
jgi:HK97 family phage portal protein